MPQPPTLKISEIFPSVQGEGLQQGEPTIFVRFSGCNLHCSFCDTRYAWSGGLEYTIAQAVGRVKSIGKRFPARWVCLTGGEPLLQDLAAFVRELKNENHLIQVETNGTQYRPLPVDWYSISPKPPSYSYSPIYRRKAKEIKLVVTKEIGLKIVLSLRAEFPAETPLLLQPQSLARWSEKKALKILNQALKAGAGNIRVSCQLHKILKLR